MSQEKSTAVVTGGSSGIGRAIAIELAKAGHLVCITYSTDAGAAEDTVKEIEAENGVAEAVCFNVADFSETQAFFKNFIKEHKRIDVLINNAGVTKDGLIAMMDENAWDRVLDINLKGTFNCIKAVTRQMMKQRYGRIINITSVVASIGNPGQANYVASKAGIIGLTKAVARELASRNITCNAIAPGFIQTKMTETLDDKLKDAMLSQIPMRRFGLPEDISKAVLFLISQNAAYITGQVMHINGGMFMG